MEKGQYISEPVKTNTPSKKKKQKKTTCNVLTALNSTNPNKLPLPSGFFVPNSYDSKES